MKRNKLKEQAFNGEIKMSDWFQNDTELFLMRKTTSRKWLKLYHDGFQAYMHGNWPRALEIFKQVLETKPEDCPSTRLMSYMEKTNFGEAPADW